MPGRRNQRRRVELLDDRRPRDAVVFRKVAPLVDGGCDLAPGKPECTARMRPCPAASRGSTRGGFRDAAYYVHAQLLEPDLRLLVGMTVGCAMRVRECCEDCRVIARFQPGWLDR